MVKCPHCRHLLQFVKGRYFCPKCKSVWATTPPKPARVEPELLPPIVIDGVVCAICGKVIQGKVYRTVFRYVRYSDEFAGYGINCCFPCYDGKLPSILEGARWERDESRWCGWYCFKVDWLYKANKCPDHYLRDSLVCVYRDDEGYCRIGWGREKCPPPGGIISHFGHEWRV